MKQNIFTREATFTPGAINQKARTAELSFSSEQPVNRWGLKEILDHSPGACDLSRLNDGAAVLWNHQAAEQIGVVESARIDPDRRGRAVIRFGNSDAARRVWQDVVDGITTKTSVSYQVRDYDLIETDDGEVLKVTKWEPYEVSLVSVPADPSVGVGRSLERSLSTTNQKRHQTMKQNAVMQIRQILDQAKKELGYADHGSIDNLIRTTKPAATGGWLNLEQLSIDAIVQRDGATRALITGEEAGRAHSIGAEIVKHSRVAAAGATVLFAPDRPAATTGEVIAWSKDAGAFVVVEAAKFSAVVDGENVTTSSLPINEAVISWDDCPSSAFSCVVTRAQQKGNSYDAADLVFRSIVAGLGREVDKTLLSAIVAARTGEVFTLDAAAAAGLKHAELSCIGSDLTSAILKIDNGKLYHGVVPCELADVINTTVTGGFNRAAVAVRPEINVLAKRLSVNGDLEITVFANLQALLPRPDAFFVG